MVELPGVSDTDRVKKLLQSMDKTELVSLILEMYSTKKEIAEYLDYYVSPNEKEQFLHT